MKLQSVQEKMCLYQFIATQPLHVGEELILAIDFSVTPIIWPLSAQPRAAQCWRGRGRKIINHFGKAQYFLNTL